MKAAIFSNHSPRVGFGVDRKMAVSRSQVMVVAASRNHLYRRRLQVVIDAGPRNQICQRIQHLKGLPNGRLFALRARVNTVSTKRWRPVSMIGAESRRTLRLIETRPRA